MKFTWNDFTRTWEEIKQTTDSFRFYIKAHSIRRRPYSRKRSVFFYRHKVKYLVRFLVENDGKRKYRAAFLDCRSKRLPITVEFVRLHPYWRSGIMTRVAQSLSHRHEVTYRSVHRLHVTCDRQTTMKVWRCDICLRHTINTNGVDLNSSD